MLLIRPGGTRPGARRDGRAAQLAESVAGSAASDSPSGTFGAASWPLAEVEAEVAGAVGGASSVSAGSRRSCGLGTTGPETSIGRGSDGATRGGRAAGRCDGGRPTR